MSTYENFIIVPWKCIIEILYFLQWQKDFFEINLPIYHIIIIFSWTWGESMCGSCVTAHHVWMVTILDIVAILTLNTLLLWY